MADESALKTNPLFATRRIALEDRKPPVIVVGLPRSGSSFLSHVMSYLDDWYVFDDLYVYRHAKSLGIEGPVTDRQLKQLLYFLGWQIRARINWNNNAPRNFNREDIDPFSEAVYQTLCGKKVGWHEVTEEWMVRLARHQGRTRWGYKTPQDFFHMSMLAGLYPGIRFVFIVRDPRKLMSSLKFVPKRDGDPGQYHPVIYPLYWRMAAREIKKQQKKGKLKILTVPFERLVANPDNEAKQIADFLDSTVSGQIPQTKKNTSFEKDRRTGIGRNCRCEEGPQQ